jgi:hypothetical protein
MTSYRSIRRTLVAWAAVPSLVAGCSSEPSQDEATCVAPCAMNPAPISGAGTGGGTAGGTAGGAGVAATAGTGVAGGAGSLPVGGAGAPATAGASASGAGGVGASGTGGDGASDPGGAGGASGGGSTNPAQALPPITDYTQEGPFATTMESNTGPGGNFTIFRPDPLGADGFMHSPIIFGPGIITTPSNYRTLLTHLASHGFVTICANSLTGGPNAPGNLTAMEMGLDWLIAQNGEAGVFQGKLAVDRAVTMGYSIGSTASVQLSSHEAILTTVAIHGHNTMGDPHGPVLLLTGTMDVIDDVRRTLTTLEEAPAVLMALPIGHLNVLTELSASGRYLGPITAWLRYWVNGDDAAKSFFWGDGCEMCGSPWITPETNALWDAQSL